MHQSRLASALFRAPWIARIALGALTVLMLSQPLASRTAADYQREFNQLHAASRWAEAERLLRAYEREHPADEWAAPNLCWVLREQKKFAAALETARAARRRWPASPYVREAWLTALGARAQELAESGAGGAGPLIQEALAAARDERTLFYYGAVLRAEKKYQASIEALEEGARLAPANSIWKTPLADSLAWSLILRGKELGDAEQHAEAHTFFKRAYELFPDRDYVAYHYAISLGAIGRDAEALPLLEAGVERFPAYAWFRPALMWAWLEQGRVRLAEKKPADALDYFERARRLAPDHEAVYYYQGLALYELRRYADAITALGAARRRFPEYRDLDWLFADSIRRRARELRAPADTARLAQLAAEARGSLSGRFVADREVLRALEEIYAMQGDFASSAAFFRERVRAFPGESGIYAIAGGHLNRHALSLGLNHPQGRALRTEADGLLRRGMTLYEAANRNRGERSLPGFPLAGPIFVAASFDDGGTHSGYGKYCYDFMGADADGRTVRANAGAANQDFIGFGAPALAVEDGVVESFANDDPDRAPGRIAFNHDGNYVAVRHADGSLGWYMHLKQGSVTVQVDQRVRRGEKLGEAGNSGMSHAPHLHFCVLDAAGVSLPIKFPPRTARSLTGSERRAGLGVYQTGWLLE